jgi:hypothetical protein
LHRLFSQWHCGAEHRGRTAALKAAAYETGDQFRDERNNRQFAYADHADGKGVIFVGVRVPSNAPLALRRDSFATPSGYDRRAHAQTILTSVASFEERQRQLHPGRNQTGHTDDRPIIGRSDVFDLDKSLVFDGNGNRRADWQKNLTRAAEDVVREKFTRRGIPAIFSIHDEQNSNGNFHVHVTSFYRQLTPEGWAQRKQRPYGEAEWRDYWADGATILRNVQLRQLSRLGVDAEPSPRLAMMPTTRSSATPPLRPCAAEIAAPRTAPRIVGPITTRSAFRCSESWATQARAPPAVLPFASNIAKAMSAAKRLQKELEAKIKRAWKECAIAAAFPTATLKRNSANRRQAQRLAL